jgi:alkylation response protein AidB-like acyl-CoA dehydrogenase
MDRYDNKVARGQISAIKIAMPNMATRVIDRAIQVHGGAGLCQDFPRSVSRRSGLSPPPSPCAEEARRPTRFRCGPHA